jgi:hypothetical protein
MSNGDSWLANELKKEGQPKTKTEPEPMTAECTKYLSLINATFELRTSEGEQRKNQVETIIWAIYEQGYPFDHGYHNCTNETCRKFCSASNLNSNSLATYFGTYMKEEELFALIQKFHECYMETGPNKNDKPLIDMLDALTKRFISQHTTNIERTKEILRIRSMGDLGFEFLFEDHDLPEHVFQKEVLTYMKEHLGFKIGITSRFMKKLEEKDAPWAKEAVEILKKD